MEKENNNVCNGHVCENCAKGEEQKGCCHFRKCCIMRKILWILVIVMVFSLGIQMGEMKSYKHRDGNSGCGMVGWNYGRGFGQKNLENVPTVNNTSVAPNTSAPAVKQ